MMDARDERVEGDPEWTAMEAEWKAGTESVAAARAELRRVGRGFASLPGWGMGAVAVSVAVFAASLWMLLQRSELGYTFGVILWSAYLSAGAFWLSLREPAGEAALATVDALGQRAGRLERSGRRLDFARTLVGVEAILCAAFWLVFEHGTGEAGTVAAGFLLIGVVGYGGLTRVLRGMRRERAELAAMAEDLRD